jgi:hypothetical protein
VFLGRLIRLLYLPGDLPLADDETVQTSGDAKQVMNGLTLKMGVQVRLHILDG